jgi:hypothetical protein
MEEHVHPGCRFHSSIGHRRIGYILASSTAVSGIAVV